MKPTVLGALFMTVGAMVLGPAPVRAQEMQYDPSALIRKLLPTVVNVTAVVAASIPAPSAMASVGDPGVDATQQKKQLGSGFVIDPEGEIVTNYHVIDGAYELVINFSDGSQTTAQVEDADRLADIAVLKVNVGHPLPAAQWGDSNAVRIGDPVLAIGNPLGVGMTVTGGIVSALNRNIMETPYDDYIQTDAPINHGNSGGPLFNMKGHVVGINSAIISPTTGSAGLGFAIPSRDAQLVIKRLREFGWFRPGWLGIKIQQVTPDMAVALGMEQPQGSIIAEVFPDSPASKAGLKVGDIVLRLNGTTPTDERSLLRDIARMAPGEHATVTILRDGKQLEIPASIVQWPRSFWNKFDAPIKQVKINWVIPPDLGLSLAPVRDDQRATYGLTPDQNGAVITAVAAGTDAAGRGIKPGDLLLQVQDRPIRSAADLRTALAQARESSRNFAMFLLLPKVQISPGPEWIPLQVKR